MMSDISILKEMIQETAIVLLKEQLEGTHSRYSVTLEERNENYAIEICNMPNHDEVIIIKADTFLAPRDIFKGSKGECKRADFVIIANSERYKIILCIELKKTKGSQKAIIQQLTGAQCFVAYCKEIGKRFWDKDSFDGDYQYRFVSISQIKTSISKVRTQISRSKEKENNAKIHDQPELMLKITSPKNPLYFDQLIGE